MCTRLFERFIFPFGLPARESEEDAERRESIRAEVWRLEHLLRSAIGAGMVEDIAAFIRRVGQNSHNYQRAFVVWIDLIDLLVQDAERRHPDVPGLGKIKTAEVKSAMRYLMQSGKFSLPNVPPALQPIVMDVVLDSVIDVIVLQLNQYDLWESPAADVSPAHIWWERFKSWFLKLFMWIGNTFGKLIAPLWEKLQAHPPLSPELRKALEAVEREGLIVGEDGILVEVSRVFIWVGTHRNSLLKTSELIFETVQEVENFMSMTGPEKKQFARDLVWTVIEDMGLAPQSGLLTALADALIDLAIESSVHLFHKHGLFQQHRQTESEMFLPA
jgi:hypothetical protein